MTSKYNPYTVPEGFFEKVQAEAATRFRRRRNAVRCGIAAAAVAAAVLIPAFIQPDSGQAAEKEIVADNLARMYDYDIFLHVNF